MHGLEISSNDWSQGGVNKFLTRTRASTPQAPLPLVVWLGKLQLQLQGSYGKVQQLLHLATALTRCVVLVRIWQCQIMHLGMA